MSTKGVYGGSLTNSCKLCHFRSRPCGSRTFRPLLPQAVAVAFEKTDGRRDDKRADNNADETEGLNAAEYGDSLKVSHHGSI